MVQELNPTTWLNGKKYELPALVRRVSGQRQPQRAFFAATFSALVPGGTGQHKKDDMKQNVLLAVLIGLNGGNLFKHISGILLPPGVGAHEFPQESKATKQQSSKTAFFLRFLQLSISQGIFFSFFIVFCYFAWLSFSMSLIHFYLLALGIL